MTNPTMLQSLSQENRRFLSTQREEAEMKKQKPMRQRGKRGVWYLNERYMGVLLQDSLDTTDERVAEIRRREIHILVESGRYHLSRLTVGEVIDQHWPEIIEGLKPNTIRVYKNSAKKARQWWGAARLCNLTDQHCVEYKRFRESEGAQEDAIRLELLVLRLVLKKAGVHLQPLPKQERFLKPRRTVDEFPTEPQVLSVLDNLEGEARAAAQIAAYSGMRKSDVLALTWDRLDFKNGWLVVRTKKSGKVVRLPLHDKLLEAFNHIPRGIGGKVFTLSDASLFRQWDHARKLAGETMRFHDLRHFFGSYLANQGVRREVIAEILGHRNLQTTARYAKFDDDTLSEAVSTFYRSQTVDRVEKKG